MHILKPIDHTAISELKHIGYNISFNYKNRHYTKTIAHRYAQYNVIHSVASSYLVDGILLDEKVDNLLCEFINKVIDGTKEKDIERDDVYLNTVMNELYDNVKE